MAEGVVLAGMTNPLIFNWHADVHPASTIWRILLIVPDSLEQFLWHASRTHGRARRPGLRATRDSSVHVFQTERSARVAPPCVPAAPWAVPGTTEEHLSILPLFAATALRRPEKVLVGRAGATQPTRASVTGAARTATGVVR